jgi:N-methylhydantoinase B
MMRPYHIDFAGSAPQCRGPLNAPQAVTESAVLYALRLLDGDDMPVIQGVYRPLTWHIPLGSILNPLPPAAVAGGNVETSQRVVDAMLAALAQAIPTRIPAQSAGTMNKLASQEVCVTTTLRLRTTKRLAVGWELVLLLQVSMQYKRI